MRKLLLAAALATALARPAFAQEQPQLGNGTWWVIDSDDGQCKLPTGINMSPNPAQAIIDMKLIGQVTPTVWSGANGVIAEIAAKMASGRYIIDIYTSSLDVCTKFRQGLIADGEFAKDFPNATP